MPVEVVGAYLRETRERRGISLDEIARQTRVPLRYLEALEASRLADLPAPVFVRGFVRAYCQALGEPPEQALARLEERGGRAAAGRTAAPAVRKGAGAPAERAAEVRSRARAAALVSLSLLIVLGAALFSLTMVVHPRDDRRAAERPGSLEASDVEQASPGPPAGGDVPSVLAAEGATTVAPVPAAPPPVTAPPAPSRPKASPVAAPPPAAVPTRPVPPVAPPPPDTQSGLESVYRLVARTTEPTWIRVRTEDGRTTEETMLPGAVREWVSNRPFELTVGNAGGVRLELNGILLPPLGASGAVISRLLVPAEPR